MSPGSHPLGHICCFSDEQQALTLPQEAVVRDHSGQSSDPIILVSTSWLVALVQSLVHNRTSLRASKAMCQKANLIKVGP